MIVSWDFFFVLVKDFRRLCSSASGIKLINNDLQTKHFELSVRLRTEPDWRETLTLQPSLQLSLMTSMGDWRRIPSGAGPAAETAGHDTPGLDLCDELRWEHNVNMLCFVRGWKHMQFTIYHQLRAQNRRYKIHVKYLQGQLILTSLPIQAIIEQVSDYYRAKWFGENLDDENQKSNFWYH